MRKAALNKSGVYFKFSAKSRAEFTAEHTAIAANYIVRSAESLPFFVHHQLSTVHARNIQTYKERLSEGILTELTGMKGMDSPSQVHARDGQNTFSTGAPLTG